MAAHHKRKARTNAHTRRTQLLTAKSVFANTPLEETEEAAAQRCSAPPFGTNWFALFYSSRMNWMKRKEQEGIPCEMPFSKM